MKPVLFEIKKHLTGKAFLVLFAILLIIPLALAIDSAGNAGQQHFSINSVGYGSGSNGTYNVSVYLYNGLYWTPIQGTTITITSPNQTLATETAGSNGFANVTLHNVSSSEASNLSYYYTSTLDGSPAKFFDPISISSGQANPYFTPFTLYQQGKTSAVYESRVGFQVIDVHGNPSLRTIGLSYDYHGLSNVPPVYIYYRAMPEDSQQSVGSSLLYSNISSGNSPIGNYNSTYLSNESQLTYFGEYQGVPFVPLNTVSLKGNTNTTTYLFEIFSSNGVELGYDVINLYVPYNGEQVSSVFLSGEVPLLGLLVPLMALISGFTNFGRARIDGSLNSVIVRPLSRRTLMGTRFFSTIASVFLPVAISLGLSSLIFRSYLGAYISPGALLLTMWALFVTTAGYAGLAYLVSTVTKSTTGLMGAIVGIFMFLDLFWSFVGNIIPSFLTSALTYGGLGFAEVNVVLDYMSPSGFVNLTSYLISGSVSNPIFLGNFHPGQVGISLAVVLGTGLAWIMIPFILSTYRFSKND